MEASDRTERTASAHLSTFAFPVAAIHFLDLVSEEPGPPPFLGPLPHRALGLVLSSFCQDLALSLTFFSYFQFLPFHSLPFPNPVFLSLFS